ncbi:MAG: O-antigen ligase family protein [Candidatus Berkelbacteria bacterium]|nr:O-antigen ligase family protein [Candidatus Berkelbacteria bacterium]
MVKNLTIKKIITVLVTLFFLFLPFERLLTFEIFGLTAKISFLILMLIVLVYFVLRLGPTLATEDKILLAFSALSYLSVFWSIDQLRSLIIATIFSATFLGFIALRRFLTPQNIEIAKTILIFWGFALCFFALWQYFGDLHNLPLTFLRERYTKIVFGFPRPQATFLEPLYFANFLFMPIFFSLERFIKSEKINWFLSLNIFLLLMVEVLTLSRGAYFSLAFAIIILVIFVGLKFKKYLKQLLIALGIGVLGIIGAVFIIYSSASHRDFQIFVQHAGATDVAGESTVARLSYSSIAWSNFKKQPWGIGTGAFGALPEFSDKLLAGNYQTVGNLYLEILVEEGIIGLLLFLFFLFINLKYFWQNIKVKKIESLILMVVFVAIFIQAVSFSALYIIPIWAFLALARPTRMDDQ